VATFAFIHGAAEVGWYWHLLEAELQARGHNTVALSRERGQSDTWMAAPWPLDAWPDVPTKFGVCRDDRFFPPDFLRGLAKERLGITADEIDGGHCAALSHPKELAAVLDTY